MANLKIGISGLGILHTDAAVPDVDTRFRMVRDCGAFDYVDRTPPPPELEAHQRAIAKYGLPLLSGGFFYMVGRDEALLERNLRVGVDCGSRYHNVQIFTHDHAGKILSDDEVADFYCKTAETAERLGITVCFENHINMWSEHPGRVEAVAETVRSRGVEFNMTMDHSHVVIKIDNPRELEVQALDHDVRSGRIELDPRQPGNVAQRWIERNYVVIAHARPTVPNNPINIWAKHPDGSFGRGVQYPWIQPQPGEWHSLWNGELLEPWKITMRQLLQHHAKEPKSRLACITLEMIQPPDYGAGARYSIFDNNVACANWIRETWQSLNPATSS